MAKVSLLKKTLTVLLIEDSADYASLVQQWLSARNDISYVLNWADSLQAGLNRLKHGGIDVILLDLGLPDSNGLETFNRTKLRAFGVPMILLSGDDSEHLALQMVQGGAQDFIVKGSCKGDSLAKAIQYAVVRHASRADSATDQATIIGVLGAKGGVGSTTIACNLAVELRRQTDEKTLLADLDLDGGTVGFLMNAEAEFTVLDAASNADRLDADYWEGLVAHCPGGLDVLCSPSLPASDQPDAENLKQVLALTRKLYRWVVVDLGRLSRFSLGQLGQLSEVFLVTTTGVPALHEAKRAIDGLRKTGVDGDRLRLIVTHLSQQQEYTGNELDRIFGVPVYATFSAANQELQDACVGKRLPSRKSDFRVNMAALARKTAGLPPEKSKSRVSQMFSFSGKSSASEAPAARVRSF